jgi:uncharacterized membrane protein required for colicin V production
MRLVWPDVLIGGIALFFALKGWKRGFVAEIAGAIALFAAIVAAIRYPGSLDDIAGRFFHVRAGAAHVVGMVIFALAVYFALMAGAWIAGRFAKLPIVSLGNRAAGAAVGSIKALAGVWAVLYVALFFPLTPDVRADLRRSAIVSAITEPNVGVDAVMRSALPQFVKPWADPIFTNHRV